MSSSRMTNPSQASPWPAFAFSGVGVALVLTALGTFWDLTDNESGQGEGLTEYLIVAGIVVVAAVALFGTVVRTAASENAGKRALVLAIVGLVTILVFWTGLPAVFAAASAACAQTSFAAGDRPKTSMAAIALNVVTVGLAILLAIVG